MKKYKKQTFKIKESVNIIDRNGRVWIIIEQSDSAIKLQAVEEDPLPNCIVVKKNAAFFMCYKEYIPPKSTRNKKTVQWYEKKEKGSYFNPVERPENSTPTGDQDIPWFNRTDYI